jgi:micrococcal nuclease
MIAALLFAAPALAMNALTGCTATDGDTIRCGDERIRLMAISAADDPASRPCRERRRFYVCDRAAFLRGKAAMAALIVNRRVHVRRFGTDDYGRTIAIVSAGGVNINCAMLASGNASYQRHFDQLRRIRRACRL